MFSNLSCIIYRNIGLKQFEVIKRDIFSLLETRLFDSKWVKIETGRGISTLTLPNLYKDDEGLYTLRMVTKGGTAGHSAFVSVSGEACWVPGCLAP